MLYPSIDDLANKTESKYLLVAAAAKRARTLRDEGNPLVENPKSHKYVGIALEEIYLDQVKIENVSK
jgi:DNA-directed RNA polymerase subunit omega